ncbi:MAG: hypothetical protein IJS15_07275 [Victivallales bacterium]|nr:hypothetical protein [Victivallales bacterium]
MSNYKTLAEQFIREETQFHLGFLPTEQSNPKSKSLEADFRESAEKGVRCLQSIDRDVLDMFRRILKSPEYSSLVEQGHETILNGGRIIFSGCGATGRLSILLESMWKKCCSENSDCSRFAASVESIMTGGDYALVRSVEFFEDYATFGRRQVQEANMGAKDMLVAITEGGETSSVLGTVSEALERGCKVFLMFNNPAKVLAEHLERSRAAIEDPRVCVLDLHCGPMALAGSTRMQATTSEQLVAGAALESIMHRILRRPEVDYAAAFSRLLDSLESASSVSAIADYMRFEANTYINKGKITYLADGFLLDIFTDTTERSPTFMLPPFRRCDDKSSPAPWAFVKNPLCTTSEAWLRGLHRAHRCLNWNKNDYTAMGAGDKILQRPPALSSDDLMKFRIGGEDMDERFGGDHDAAVLVTFGTPSNDLTEAFKSISEKFASGKILSVNATLDDAFNVTAECADGALELIRHIALKLVLNTISTGTMALLGRISGNWMSWVDCTNKKLIDRGTRLLVELGETDYRNACETLFKAMDALGKIGSDIEKPSPVQLALSWLKSREITNMEDLDGIDQGWELMVGDGKCEPVRITPSDMNEFAFSVTATGIQKVWKGSGTLGKNFTVRTTWRRNSDGLMTGRIEYDGRDSKLQIEEIRFPLLKVHCDVTSNLLLNPFLMQDACSIPSEKDVCSFLRMTQCFALLNTHGQSCHLEFHDTEFFYKRLFFRRCQNEMSAIVGGSFMAPLESSAPRSGAVPYDCCVSFFNGGWYDSAQIYRNWALKQDWWANQPAHNPLEDICIWVWNRGLVKDAIPPVERLQDILGDRKVAIDWYWWHSNPYDTDYPNFWPPREGEDTFRAAVKRLSDKGIYSQVYVNGVCWDHDTSNWDEGGADGAVILRDGKILERDFNKYNHHRLAWMCGEAPKFHDKISFVVGKLISSGLSGQYLDMIGGASQSLCHNPKHSHAHGGGHYCVDGFRKLLARLRRENPNAALTTEFANEAYMGFVDGAIICNEGAIERHGGTHFTPIPAFNAIYHGKFVTFGNYTLPDGIPPWDPLWPDADRWQNERPWHKLYPEQFFVEMARPVIWGAQPMVCNLKQSHFDNPELADEMRFILDSAKIYGDNRDFLYSGTMLSPDGFDCESKEIQFLQRGIFTTEKTSGVTTRRLPCILHSFWQSQDGRRALFMANITQSPQAWSFQGKNGSIAPRSYLKVDF